mmetsp:Transcript_10395/g.28634  ORF Transcript_10395/g.28634 Transcript_10395/m.28634 type:complete len:373 (-) Transcript_10395:331-1449(-)
MMFQRGLRSAPLLRTARLPTATPSKLCATIQQPWCTTAGLPLLQPSPAHFWGQARHVSIHKMTTITTPATQTTLVVRHHSSVAVQDRCRNTQERTCSSSILPHWLWIAGAAIIGYAKYPYIEYSPITGFPRWLAPHPWLLAIVPSRIKTVDVSQCKERILPNDHPDCIKVQRFGRAIAAGALKAARCNNVKNYRSKTNLTFSVSSPMSATSPPLVSASLPSCIVQPNAIRAPRFLVLESEEMSYGLTQDGDHVVTTRMLKEARTDFSLAYLLADMEGIRLEQIERELKSDRLLWYSFVGITSSLVIYTRKYGVIVGGIWAITLLAMNLKADFTLSVRRLVVAMAILVHSADDLWEEGYDIITTLKKILSIAE